MRIVGFVAAAALFVLSVGACSAGATVVTEEPGYVVAGDAVYDPSPYDSTVYVVRGAPVGYYYADGYYWGHHRGGWWRTHGRGSGWSHVDVGVVPHRVVSVHARY